MDDVVDLSRGKLREMGVILVKDLLFIIKVIIFHNKLQILLLILLLILLSLL